MSQKASHAPDRVRSTTEPVFGLANESILPSWRRTAVSCTYPDLEYLYSNSDVALNPGAKHYLIQRIAGELLDLGHTILRKDDQCRSYLEVAERDDTTRIGTVRYVNAERRGQWCDVTLLEHDKAFIFDTKWGLEAYYRTAQCIDFLKFSSSHPYLGVAASNGIFAAARQGDAFIIYTLRMGSVSASGQNQGVLAAVTMDVSTNPIANSGIERYSADFLSGAVDLSLQSHPESSLIERDINHHDLEFAIAHFNRLMSWAAGCVLDQRKSG
ncbi:MAG: hypothetical protein J5J00_08060 [Deltaproteobacteria bacterium]|nr:hypothetical protein [Deltaproteobacteria bacterium]